MSGIAPKQNAFKFKISPHKQKSIVNFFWQEDEAPLGNEALCLSTPKHNGKSGTGYLSFFYSI
jgi:outer membrane biogenesis lipoprotein LolB